LSVALALSMAYNEAAGETKEAMRRTLKTEGLSLDEVNEASAALINSLMNHFIRSQVHRRSSVSDDDQRSAH